MSDEAQRSAENDARKRALKWLRPYLPNTSTRMALVSLDDERPFRAYWPIRLTQIIGGKTWSISFTRFQAPTPTYLLPPASTEGGA